MSLVSNLNRKALTVGLGEAGAANAWAGTTGLETVHALNVKAANTLPNYKGLAGVLNQLAGTVGREVDGAADAL